MFVDPVNMGLDIGGWIEVTYRSEGETDEQFVYKTRKKLWGPFKQQVWTLPKESAEGIGHDLQTKFEFLMDQLNATNTTDLVARYIRPVQIEKPVPASLKSAVAATA